MSIDDVSDRNDRYDLPSLECLFFVPVVIRYSQLDSLLTLRKDDSASLAEMLAPLNLQSRELVCMPINNNNEISKAGGSHWYVIAQSFGSDACRGNFDRCLV